MLSRICKTCCVIIGIWVYIGMHTPIAFALVFKSQPVGLQAGDGIKTAQLAGDNLIYGVLGASTTGSLLLLQNGSGNDRFRVDVYGNLTAVGTIDANQLCIQAVCKSSWQILTEADTLQSVTTLGNTTTQPITVATVNTGNGDSELYVMNQNIRTNDAVTFAVVTATGGNSADWNSAYSERLQWDGGATNLNAVTGRASLGLGTLATLSVVDASNITSNIVSSIEGVSNDGGNINLVAGSNISITPSDPPNRITIAEIASGGAWNDAGIYVYPTTLSDSIGIGNNAPESALHVGTASNPSWSGTKLTVVENANVSADDSAVVYIQSSGSLGSTEVSTLNVTAFGALTNSNSSALSVQAQNVNSTAGSVIRLESEDTSVNFLQAQNAADTEIITLLYTGGAYFSGSVGINIASPNYDLEVNGTMQASLLLLGNYNYYKPTCNGATLGNIVYDYYYSANKVYICASSGWRSLDTDYDSDGIKVGNDADDNNFFDASATTADVKSGKTFYANGQHLTGTGFNISRPGCSPGDYGMSTSDQLYDYCNNDHDWATDELDPVNMITHLEVGYPNGHGIKLDVAGQTCYFYPGGPVWAADGKFPVKYNNYDTSKFCELKHGSGWYAVGQSRTNETTWPCLYNNGTTWFLEGYGGRGPTYANQAIWCNNQSDDVRN